MKHLNSIFGFALLISASAFAQVGSTDQARDTFNALQSRSDSKAHARDEYNVRFTDETASEMARSYEQKFGSGMKNGAIYEEFIESETATSQTVDCTRTRKMLVGSVETVSAEVEKQGMHIDAEPVSGPSIRAVIGNIYRCTN